MNDQVESKYPKPSLSLTNGTELCTFTVESDFIVRIDKSWVEVPANCHKLDEGRLLYQVLLDAGWTKLLPPPAR